MNYILFFVSFFVWIIYFSKASKDVNVLLNIFLSFFIINSLFDGQAGGQKIGIADYYDLIGLYLFLTLIIKLSHRDYSVFAKNKGFRIFVIYYIASLIIVILSIEKFGITTMSNQRLFIYVNTLFFVLLGYPYSGNSYITLIGFLRKISGSVVVIYILKVVGVLNRFNNYRWMGDGSYGDLRYISNAQVLYLLLYFIAISLLYTRKIRNRTKKIDKALSVASLILIVISTQRMILLLLLLYFIILGTIKMTNYIKYAIIITVLVTSYSFFSKSFIVQKVIDSITNITDPSNFGKSTADVRLQDVTLSLNYMIEYENIYMGRLIQPRLFIRKSDTRTIPATRFVHNQLIMTFVQGGLFLVLPLLVLWLYIMLNLFIMYVRERRMFSKTKQYNFYYIEYIFITTILIFLMNNVSGGTWFNAIILSQGIILINIQKKWKVKS